MVRLMDSLAQIAANLWPIVAAFICVFAWAIRLEAKVLYLEKHNENTEEKDKAIWAKFDVMQSTLTAVLQSLSRLEGRLEGAHVERN